MATAPLPSNTHFRAIAVVGSSSNFGALLLKELEATMPDCQLMAIDSYPLLQPVKQVSAYRMEPNRAGAILTIDDIPDVMQLKAWDIVLENRRLTMADVADAFHLESVDCVVHVGSLYDKANPQQFVGNTDNWIQACRLAGVRQLVYLSDVRVYGAKRKNPIPLTERSNPNPAAEHRFILDAELPLQESSGNSVSSNSLKIAILRSAMTAGPSGCTPATNELLWPAVKSKQSRSIPIQLVHQHDLTRAVRFTLLHQLNGIYNVASRGVVGSNNVLDMFQNGSASKANRSKRRGKPATRSIGRYPLIVSDTKFRQAANFEAAYSSEQAARAYCHSYLHEMNSRHGQ